MIETRNKEILRWARETINIEQKAISALLEVLDDNFISCVELILACTGRVVITGIGKSAAIASKIVATLNSTGTPSMFMHAADAVHGDLGMIRNDDVIICISKSGNTPEIKALIPLLKMSGHSLIGMVGNSTSVLAKQADFVLDVTVEKEACPNNLAPTTSTTAQLVMGDALAICLLKARGFTSKDFAKYHPGGALGKRLYLTLRDIAEQNAKPVVSPEDPVRSVIVELTSNRLGAVVVMRGEDVIGIITDGDIRRMLEKHSSIDTLKAGDIMGANPLCLNGESLAVDAMKLMSERKISQIIVLNNNQYAGIVHIHDLNREGILLS